MGSFLVFVEGPAHTFAYTSLAYSSKPQIRLKQLMARCDPEGCRMVLFSKNLDWLAAFEDQEICGFSSMSGSI